MLAVLEQAIDNVLADNPKKKVGGMIQVSGIRIRYDAYAAKGNRVTKIDMPHGSWDVKQSYLVATNSMLATGGHQQQAFLRGTEMLEHGSQYDTIKVWFSRHSPISTPEPGRITPTEANLNRQEGQQS